MLINLDPIATFTWSFEGGYSADREDTGNWLGGLVGGTFIGSNFGVDADDLADYMHPVVPTAADMINLPKATAETIFGGSYFQRMNGAALPGGLDLQVIDSGYNIGAPASVRQLQALVGLKGADVDGWLGDETLAAIDTVNALSLAAKLTKGSVEALQKALGAVVVDGSMGPLTRGAIALCNPYRAKDLVLCCALADVQAAHYRSLAQFPKYGGGWLARAAARLTLSLTLVG